MGNAERVARGLSQMMKEQGMPASLVARRSGVPYKRVLAEVKHRTSPIKLETALAVADAIGTDAGELIADELARGVERSPRKAAA